MLVTKDRLDALKEEFPHFDVEIEMLRNYLLKIWDEDGSEPDMICVNMKNLPGSASALWNNDGFTAEVQVHAGGLFEVSRSEIGNPAWFLQALRRV